MLKNLLKTRDRNLNREQVQYRDKTMGQDRTDKDWHEKTRKDDGQNKKDRGQARAGPGKTDKNVLETNNETRNTSKNQTHVRTNRTSDAKHFETL